MASRGIYHDGWFASAPGPREPWVGGMPKGIKEWSPLTDKWELYNIDADWSQANDLAAANPQKLEEMKALFIVESTKNKNLPIGGGLWSTAMFHPEDAPASPLTEWTFDFAHHRACPNRRRPSSARTAASSPWRSTCPRTPTACSTRWPASPAASRPT